MPRTLLRCLLAVCFIILLITLSLLLRRKPIIKITGGKEDQLTGFPQSIIDMAEGVPAARSINYKELKATPESAYSSLMPRDIPHVRKILRQVCREDPKHIIDANAHVGVDSLNFTATYPGVRVTSIELNAQTYKALTHNTAGKSITPVLANSVDYLQRKPAERADLVYFDPPWGGPGKKGHTIELKDNSGRAWSLPALVKLVFDNGVSPVVMLKLPSWYDLRALVAEMSTMGDISLYPVAPKKVSYWLMVVKKVPAPEERTA